MAQYINREKLLKRMEGYCEANCGCKPHEDALCPSCGLGDAIYMVEEQRIVNSRNMRGRKDATVALSKMEKTAEWIPVTERLPEENGFYLCLYELKQKGGVGMDEALGILQFLNNKWTIYGSYIVTHWFPIPEPPKEER